MLASARKRLLILSGCGGLLGFFAEGIHRRAGVWVLPAEAALPVWIIAVYFLGLLGAGLAFAALERRIVPPLIVNPQALIANLVAAALLFLGPPLLHRHELLLFAIVLLALTVRLIYFRQPGDVGVVLGVILVDAVIEMTLISLSFFRYVQASLGPLPLWLPPLWGGLGLALRRLFLASTTGLRI